MASFSHAERLGADLVELDVQRTADGALVVLHDATLDRTTTGTGAVGAHTADAIRSLDAGAWFGPAFRGERVPFFNDLCAWAAVRRLRLSVELKQPERGRSADRDAMLAASVIAVLERHALSDRVLVHSFDPVSVAEVRMLEPRIATGLLCGAEVHDPLSAARAVDAAGVHVAWERATAALCAAAHAEGRHVHASGLPEPPGEALVRACAEQGADSMETDTDPGALVDALAALGLHAPRAVTVRA